MPLVEKYCLRVWKFGSDERKEQNYEINVLFQTKARSKIITIVRYVFENWFRDERKERNYKIKILFQTKSWAENNYNFNIHI